MATTVLPLIEKTSSRWPLDTKLCTNSPTNYTVVTSCFVKVFFLTIFQTTKVLPKLRQFWIFVQLACFTCQKSFLTSYKKQTNKQRPCMPFCIFNIFILNSLLWAWICYVMMLQNKVFWNPLTLLYLAHFACFACPGEFLLVSFLT